MWLYFIVIFLFYVAYENLRQSRADAAFHRQQQQLILSLFQDFAAKYVSSNGVPRLRYSSILLPCTDVICENFFQVTPLKELERTTQGKKFIWFALSLVNTEGLDNSITLLYDSLDNFEVNAMRKPGRRYIRNILATAMRRYQIDSCGSRWKELLRPAHMDDADIAGRYHYAATRLFQP